ncbi:glycoside hydrolase [Lewinellaceae bacterium SD302]|nr:glycoside hydrolase [Lewinellaceae bacterium SD302]
MSKTAKKFVCIHGHFYQPPRENAWLETIESQPSAAPFHDWNERINFECYAPNAVARVLNDEQRITSIANNYARISFNFGPTLLSWLEANDPTTYQRILQADLDSRERFGGHGSAVAQVYNHLIMPLANERDRYTQIRWGIADFERRFNRRPEGMWLAETAADTATLLAMKKQGIKYTILAPRQGRSVRKAGEEHWHDIHEGNLNTRRAYRCPLPDGEHIDVFFYDGMVSRAVAFEGLLNDGRFLADKLINSLEHESDEVQLANIATDGESYGHHHKKGEMALASCLNHIDDHPDFELTNYGEFLELHPPQYECRIHDNSSWSCVHGVERWRSNCGCHTGGEAGWNQSWRGPLREALDFVREKGIQLFEDRGAEVLNDPWAARNDYIDLVLERSPENVSAFVASHFQRETVSDDDLTLGLRLLEMQRHAMLMYTSCGWFFNEVSGIETLQILQYALRALHLIEVISGEDHTAAFEKLLEQTPSNKDANAAVSYRHHVKPAKVGLKRVAMHFAAASLFEEEPEEVELFTYRGASQEFERLRAGSQRLAIGRTTIQNSLTFSESTYSFVCLYLGQQNVIGYLTKEDLPLEYAAVEEELSQRFRQSELAYMLHGMRKYFGDDSFSIYHLFHDEKAAILEMITQQSLDRAAQSFSDVYYDNYQLMSSMRENQLRLPRAYVSTIAFTMQRRVYEALTASVLDLRRLSRIEADFLHWGHEWSPETKDQLELYAEERVYEEIMLLTDNPFRDTVVLSLLSFLKAVGLEPNLWKSQNVFVRYLEGLEETEIEGKDQIAELLGVAKLPLSA